MSIIEDCLIVPADEYLATGTDGKGRNRLRIEILDPLPRCSHQPLTWQAAYDTARGMARFGVWTAYAPCTGPYSEEGKCSRCKTVGCREDWNSLWIIREDVNRAFVWILDGTKRQSHYGGWGALGFAYRGWAALFRSALVPILSVKYDEFGRYFVERVGDTE